MRACVQRVSSASVSVDGGVTGSCGRGFLVLLGVGPGDDEQTARRLWEKIFRLRVFDDRDGKMNLSLAQVDGEVLVVSQFTLYADCRRGNRPSFTDAAKPPLSVDAYELFLAEMNKQGLKDVQHGEFGADMQVSLVNDGPITIWLDTDELSRPKR